LRRAEGGAKTFGVFRVKNHDFTPKNHIFSNFMGRALGAPLDPPMGYSHWPNLVDLERTNREKVLSLFATTKKRGAGEEI
jgi:hypothetical protein